jgi:hypothetical protein
MEFSDKLRNLKRMAYAIQCEKTGNRQQFALQCEFEKDRLDDYIAILRVLATRKDAELNYNKYEKNYYFYPQGKFTDFKFRICFDNQTDSIPQDVPHQEIKFIKELNTLTKMAYFIHLRQTGTRKDFAQKCELKEDTLKKYIIILKELAWEEDAKIRYNKHNKTYYFDPQGYFTNFEFIIMPDYQGVEF